MSGSTVWLEPLLPHSPTHTHTVRQTTVGVGTWVALVAPRAARGSVHDGVGGEGDCWYGVALSVWTLEWWKGSNDPAVVLRLLGSRNPSEWSVGLGFHLNGPLCFGFHLNGPLCRWIWKGVGDLRGCPGGTHPWVHRLPVLPGPSPDFQRGAHGPRILQEPRT